MATNYQVNLQISSGSYFYQTFYITNPDFSPVDLTDCNIFAAIAKHARAVDATKPFDEFNSDAISFNTGVLDPKAGSYYIEMSVTDTLKLEEGKYVYNIVIETPSDEETIIEAAGGLVFVSTSFGLIRNQETDEEEPEPEQQD